MRSSAYNCVYIYFVNYKINVNFVERLCFYSSYYVLRHFNNYISVLLISYISCYLKSCTIEWNITILNRPYQYHIFKILQTHCLT